MATKVVDINVVPEKMLKLTRAWMDKYMEEKATAKQLKEYYAELEQLGNVEDFNNQRKAFVKAFDIKFPKKEKGDKTKHKNFIDELIKKKEAKENGEA